MRTITEKLSELEFQEISYLYEGLDTEDVDEGLKELWAAVKDKISIIAKKIKNRVIMCFTDGTAIPAVSPANSGLAIGAGEAGKSTFFAPAGNAFKEFGVKKNSMAEIIKDFEKNKKSIFEGGPERYANILEANNAATLSGAGKYGPDVNTEQFKNYLHAAIKNPEFMPPLIVWGAPGIGKTAIVKQVLKEFYGKKTLIVKNLGQCQKDDFSLPAFDKDKEGNIIAANEVPKTWLPMYRVTGDKAVDAAADNIANGATKDGEIGEGGVIFFDEIARCGADVQAVALSLIEDRELVGYRLGSKWAIVAASNREMDDPNMDITLSKALGNRFGQINYVPVFAEWRDWAAKKGWMNDDIVNFLAFNQKYWYLMHPDDDDEKVFASSRSWDKACKALCCMAGGAKEDGFDLDSLSMDVIQRTLEMFVQPATALEFITYYKLTRAVDINALHNVFKNPKKAPNLKTGKNGALRTDVKYYMVSKVLSGMDTTKMPEPEEMKNLAEWLVTGGDESIAAAAIHTLFEMFNTPENKIKFMIGDPSCQKISGYEKKWNMYIDFSMTLIKGIPSIDKDLEVNLK